MTGLIIGFGHVARSGKDLAATALTAAGRHEDRRFRRMGFADELKRLALMIDTYAAPHVKGFGAPRMSDVTKDGREWDHAKDEYPEVRRTLEALGQSCRDVFGQTIWVDIALRSIQPHERVVFTDVRYLNEALAIQAHGGRVVKIHRPGYEPTLPSDMHLAGWDGWDAVIENDGSTSILLEKVRTLADGWLNMPPPEPEPEESWDDDDLSLTLYQQQLCAPGRVNVMGEARHIVGEIGPEWLELTL